MECKNQDCGNKVSYCSDPKYLLQFSVPFTKIEIIVLDWSNKKLNEYCDECMIEDYPCQYTNSDLDVIYNSRYEQGAEDRASGF